MGADSISTTGGGANTDLQAQDVGGGRDHGVGGISSSPGELKDV